MIRKLLKVQSTNDSSILSKHSTVKAGYFQDEFLKYFVTKDANRAPLINRGYYIRMKAVSQILLTFLESNFTEKKQVISLGAGFDTSYFRFKSHGLLKNTKFFEVDFPEVVKHKSNFVKQNTLLTSTLGALCCSELPGIHTVDYSLIGSDLRDLPKVQKQLLDCGLDTGYSTLLLSEVVLSYLDPSSSSAVIGWAADLFSDAVFVAYEQVYPDDPFGIVMMNHFNQLGSPLRSISTYPTPQAQVNRYIEQGWSMARFQDMNSFYNSLPTEERRRIDMIEPFDEFEEWHLKCAHYILLTAFKGSYEALCHQMLPITNGKSSEKSFSAESITPQLLRVGGKGPMKRYGHCAGLLSDGTILVTGGFGLHGSKHMRIPGVCILSKSQGGDWHCSEAHAVSSEEAIGSRMFHTMTVLDNDVILIHGGRTSPYKPCATTHLLITRTSVGYHGDTSSCCHGNVCKRDKVPNSLERDKTSNSNDSSVTYTVTSPECQGRGPSPRWRHTATRISHVNGKQGVLILGGKSLSESALGDCYILGTTSYTWKEVTPVGAPLEPRHSHTCTSWNLRHVIIYGGLGIDASPLSSLQLLDIQTMKVENLEPTPSLPARYSHTAHVHNDNLILIGGVIQGNTGNPDITVLNMTSLTWKSYSLPVCPSVSPLMMHNHTSVDRGAQGIMVFGGGGNCFSFGTHLNDMVLTVYQSELTAKEG